jgi:predicted nuclease of predicted toxin-antitoxin system
MLRLLSDECFDGRIVRGLHRVAPALDLVRVQDVGLSGVGDPSILAWAAAEDRILLTHDRQTIPGFAYGRIRAGKPMPGVFVINDKVPVRDAIDAIRLADGASQPDDWRDRVEFLPY